MSSEVSIKDRVMNGLMKELIYIESNNIVNIKSKSDLVRFVAKDGINQSPQLMIIAENIIATWFSATALVPYIKLLFRGDDIVFGYFFNGEEPSYDFTSSVDFAFDIITKYIRITETTLEAIN